MNIQNGEQDWMFEIPTGSDFSLIEFLFGYPMQYTDGQYVNILLFGVFGTFFIGSMYQQNRADIHTSTLYASIGTFVTTFLLSILSTMTETTIAGQNQLIPATMILIAAIIWNYMAKQQTTV